MYVIIKFITYNFVKMFKGILASLQS